MYVSVKNIQVTLLKITKACSLLSIRFSPLMTSLTHYSKMFCRTLLSLQGRRPPNLSHNDSDRMTPSEK